MINSLLNWLSWRKDDNFESAITTVLHHEGLLSNDKNDPGGITNFGVSLRFLRAAGIDGDGNRDNHVTAQDIRSLNVNQAKSIYYKYYWLKYDIDEINSPMLATSVLDMSVLMGNHEAILCMQRALNKVDRCGIQKDGIMGIRTLGEINRASPYKLNEAFKEELHSAIALICQKNPKLLCFKEGWTNRINSL